MQRNATKDACKIAGLKCVRLFNEPTAAALAFGVDRQKQGDTSEKTILIFDFGGGTLDVTIMKIESDGRFKVLATNGDTNLGGQDIDNAICKFLMNDFKE